MALKEQSSLERGARPEFRWSFVAAVFAVAALLLFLSMSVRPGVYDEGIMLTDTMRIMAGQVPHRDFYAIYGPAEFYLLAGLFKVFGVSLLVERLLFLGLTAGTVAAVYGIVAYYCRQAIALWSAVATICWLYTLNAVGGSAMYPTALCNLLACVLVVPVFWRKLSPWRFVAAGAAAGMATLFRYDTGIAMLAIEACVVAGGVWLRFEGLRNRVIAFVVCLCASVAGFVLVVAPIVGAYLAVAPARDFLFDVFTFPSKYYRRARSLPFPHPSMHDVASLGVYLPVMIACVAFGVVVVMLLGAQRLEKRHPATTLEVRRWCGLLITFGLLTLVMYLKGLVRVSPSQMYLSILPSLLLIALVYERRSLLRPWVSIVVLLLMILSVAVPVRASLATLKAMYKHHDSAVYAMWSDEKHKGSAATTTWCDGPSVLIKGFCFLPEDDRRDTVEFLESHTKPSDTLFVGVSHHDRIFINDNILYFATQRLPATKWQHFDPLLQSRLDIQEVMIGDLERNKPPYVVLDAEWDTVNEPNESSKSTGVKALDEYLEGAYRPVATFGNFTVEERVKQ